jgi:hypothetical protein
VFRERFGARPDAERRSVIPHMHMTAVQRRRTRMILFAAGSLPFVAAATVAASAFVLPSVFRSVFDLFAPPNVDAPDNWAVAITRMVWLFVVSGGIGVTLAGVGLWLSRGAV